MSEVAEEWLDGIAARLGCQISAGTAPGGEETTVRDLLATFGHMRRGKRVVAEIREALERRGLRTEPDFEYEWVDDPVSLVLDDGAEVSGLAKAVDPTVRVGVLPAAHVDLISVKRDDPLMRATTLMRIGDFSQLPVMQDERDVKGVVSWKSIGVVYARGGEPESVVECMDEAQIIDSWKPLEEAAELIFTHDYVLVRDKERRITGIVTGADLATQFKELSHPFFADR